MVKKQQSQVRRPSSAYLFYCADVRSSVKESNPDSKSTEITKIIGKMWREISPEDKEQYLQKALVDKERYLQEKKVLEDSKPKKPKRPLTPYMVFSNKVRPSIKEENPGITLGDTSKKISELWKNLSAEEKTEFIDISKKDKDRYDTEIISYTEQQQQVTEETKEEPPATTEETPAVAKKGKKNKSKK